MGKGISAIYAQAEAQDPLGLGQHARVDHQSSELCGVGPSHLQGGSIRQRAPSRANVERGRNKTRSFLEGHARDEDQGYDRGISHIIRFQDGAGREGDRDSDVGDDEEVDDSYRNPVKEDRPRKSRPSSLGSFEMTQSDERHP